MSRYETLYSRDYCPRELASVKDVTNTSPGLRDMNVLYESGRDLAPTNTWAEFGVGGGRSTRNLLSLLCDEGVIHLFDSWRGIPEPWKLGDLMTEPKGSWKFPRIKTKDTRVNIVDGLFIESLPFNFSEQIGLMNIDCDIYSSCRDVLFGCVDWIKAGTVLIFDELLGYANYAEHEYKALNEWRRHTGHNVEWVAKEQFGAMGVVV